MAGRVCVGGGWCLFVGVFLLWRVDFHHLLIVAALDGLCCVVSLDDLMTILAFKILFHDYLFPHPLAGVGAALITKFSPDDVEAIEPVGVLDSLATPLSIRGVVASLS